MVSNVQDTLFQENEDMTKEGIFWQKNKTFFSEKSCWVTMVSQVHDKLFKETQGKTKDNKLTIFPMRSRRCPPTAGSLPQY